VQTYYSHYNIISLHDDLVARPVTRCCCLLTCCICCCSYNNSGFEATSYLLQTDQYGTQLDPPAHWAPHYAAIDEIPASYAVRPLVVINVAGGHRQQSLQQRSKYKHVCFTLLGAAAMAAAAAGWYVTGSEYRCLRHR
jgi:hypothetical protein